MNQLYTKNKITVFCLLLIFFFYTTRHVEGIDHMIFVAHLQALQVCY
jgi:hypothetical protein